jgi:hypothetical protein
MMRLVGRLSAPGVLLALLLATYAFAEEGRTPVAVASSVRAADPDPGPTSLPPDTLRLASGSVGGTFLPVAHDLAAWWNAHLSSMVVVVDTTAGSIENIHRLVGGEADLAVVGSSPFREVLVDHGFLAENAQQICTVGTLYEDAEQYVVRSSLVRVGNLLDLNGLRMYPGPHNSGAEIDTRRILMTLGIEPRYVYADERDKGYAAAAAALLRGDFDAVTFSGGVPIEAVTDLFRDHPGEFRILPFSRHMLRKLQYYTQDYEGVVIHADSYPGQTEDIQSVGGPNVLVAAPGVPAEQVAALDAALRRGIAVGGQGLRAQAAHPVLRRLTVDLWGQTPVGSRCQLPETAGLSPAPVPGTP